MRRMHQRYGEVGPAKKRQIDRHEKDGAEETGLDEDVRVTHSGEANPHDG